jgi:hypothetical protein
MNLAAPQAMLKAVFRDDILRRMLTNVSLLLSGTAGAGRRAALTGKHAQAC